MDNVQTDGRWMDGGINDIPITFLNKSCQQTTQLTCGGHKLEEGKL